MIRKSEYFEQTDKFLNSELTLPELNEFEAQLGNDSELADELNLQMDVEMALAETDLISLRKNLNQIVQNQTDPAYNEISVFDAFSFGLSEEFSAHKKLGNQINSEDIFNFGHTFPQIHLYQHNVAGKENIHQFYKEQADNESSATEDLDFSAFDEELFSEVRNALDESDISELRANLNQIAHTLPAHQYSTQEIEDFVYNRMNTEAREQFEQEMTVNQNLAQDVRLISEIDLAGAESDIMNLRASLKQIQENELFAPVSIENIEKYIHSELYEPELAFFEEQITSNQELRDEIELIKNIDLAIQENEIMQLRSKLQDIAGQTGAEKRTERSILAGKFRIPRAVVISSVAASLILLLGITGLLSKHSSPEAIYQKFYARYETSGIVRAATAAEADQAFSMAMQKFDNQDYNTAINLFSQITTAEPDNMAGHFYQGIALQETGKYAQAIEQYQTVITNNDNLFAEQAQWYIGLCYLQTKENKKAIRQFKYIAKNEESSYQQKARDILRKLKFSDD